MQRKCLILFTSPCVANFMHSGARIAHQRDSSMATTQRRLLSLRYRCRHSRQHLRRSSRSTPSLPPCLRKPPLPVASSSRCQANTHLLEAGRTRPRHRACILSQEAFSKCRLRAQAASLGKCRSCLSKAVRSRHHLVVVMVGTTRAKISPRRSESKVSLSFAAAATITTTSLSADSKCSVSFSTLC